MHTLLQYIIVKRAVEWVRVHKKPFKTENKKKGSHQKKKKKRNLKTLSRFVSCGVHKEIEFLIFLPLKFIEPFSKKSS